MEALTKSDIYGTWATLMLPIDTDDEINYQKLGAQIDNLISSGIAGIYSNGTAGEFYNQTEEEFDRVSQLLAEKCDAANMPFQIGCCHMSPKISLERLKRILDLKPGAIQVILPDWYPPSMTEVISYLRKMTDTASGIGLVLYNPGHAKKKLTPEEFQQIARSGVNLVGCKLGGGDEEWYKRMTGLNPGLSLFTPGHKLATGIGFGAHGSYSNVACINPSAAQKWYKQMLDDREGAMELQQRIQIFIVDYIIPYITKKNYSDQAVDKLMACIGGWADIGTRLRWPYRSIGESEVESLRKVCRSLLPEFFNQ